jgi:Domain of unknown function (DUF4294)
MFKKRKYYSNYIAIASSLALYGVCFLLLSLDTGQNDSVLDLLNQDEEKFSIDIQNDFSLSDLTNNQQTAKGSVDVNKKAPIPPAGQTKSNESSPPEEQKIAPIEESVTLEEDPLLQSKINDMVAELETPANKDSVQKIEKKLLEAATQKKQLNDEEINRLNKEEQQFYRKNYKTILSMRKIYPSVLAVKKIVDELNKEVESSKNKKEKQQLIKSAEQKLFNEFEKDIRVMSYSQGKLLVKLLARETDQTAYNIIKKYKGTIPATFWYGVGILFQENLKTKYDSTGEDAHLERMVKKYKTGTL